MTSPLADLIRAEIGQHGAIPFARFMELALYHPEHGYYERGPANVGRRGDFYTSVSVGPLFGELLAGQFAQWAESGVRSQESGAAFQIVEAGAHDGRLAADILRWFRQWQPALFARIEYWIVEPSLRRQEWQRETLAEFASQVRWLAGLPADPSAGQFRGVLFANELLDAFPVHRLGWDARAREWFEWGVGVRDGSLVWKRMEARPAPAGFPLPDALLAVLPDGFILETCPAATVWWEAAARCLQSGRLLTFDYGLTAEEFLSPARAGGTLRAYHQHHQSADLLAQPGEQDLTAHVNFTALQAAGERAGLRTEGLFSQTQFLTRIAEASWRTPTHGAAWDSVRARQFQTLTHPQHLGRAFRVLVQTR